MNRKLRLVFLGSLLLNVVLIGVLLGESPRRLDRDARREQRLEQALAGLPQQSQTRLREKYAELRAVAQPLFAEIRAAQDEAARALSAEPFDRAAYERQILDLNRLRVASTNRLSEVAREIAVSLPAEERRKFTELLRRPRAPERGD